MIAAAVVLTAPFVPMLFQGEEWAASTPFQYFTAHEDPELGAAVGRGRRDEFAAFGWNPDAVPDPQAVETFQRSKLNWSEASEPEHAAALDWHRRLIRLRQDFPELRDGCLADVAVEYDAAAGWLSYCRGRVAVAINLGQAEARIPIASGRLALTSEQSARIEDLELVLPRNSVAVGI